MEFSKDGFIKSCTEHNIATVTGCLARFALSNRRPLKEDVMYWKVWLVAS
jgi:hypothetical protein